MDISIQRPDFEKSRGQVGIETLVVFIAMILVAALAAGVLINTAGFLQNKASATSHDSQAQVSNQVRIIGAVGTVETGTESTANNITSINLSVMQAPGAEEIDLGGATVRYIGPNGATTLIYNDSQTNTADDGIQNDTVAGASAEYGTGTFGVIGVKDTDDSAPVLNSQEDRFQINIELANATNNQRVQALTALQPGQEATLRIVTMSGAQSTYIVNVPQSLSSTEDGEAVSL